MTETERATILASQHWQYVAGVLAVHGVMEEELTIIGHHYRTGFCHGMKHGISDERNGLFRPRIGEPLTDSESASISAKISNGLCPCFSCAVEACADAEPGMIRCSNYVPKDKED